MTVRSLRCTGDVLVWGPAEAGERTSRGRILPAGWVWTCGECQGFGSGYATEQDAENAAAVTHQARQAINQGEPMTDPSTEAIVAERERLAAAIEAAIVTGPADRYERWPCGCLDGEKCYPHLAAEAMNAVTAQEGYEDWWPAVQAGALWDALEPVILRAAASIARPW